MDKFRRLFRDGLNGSQGVHLFEILGIRQWPIPQEQYSFSKSSLRISKMCVRELHETIREDIIHTPNIHLISKNTMAARHPAVWRLINYLELVARLNHSGNERRGDYRRFFVATKAGEMSIEVVTSDSHNSQNRLSHPKLSQPFNVNKKRFSLFVPSREIIIIILRWLSSHYCFNRINMHFTFLAFIRSHRSRRLEQLNFSHRKPRNSCVFGC